MSITITTDVFCDACVAWTNGVTGGGPRSKAARAVAFNKGWGRLKRNGRMLDLCPTCLEDERQGSDR